VIVELSGKLPEAQFVHDRLVGDRDVIEALRAMGYSASEAQQALIRANISPEMTVEERVVAAFQQLSDV
jgi:Holliday junction resolvasome RuvABC DNA-binding subunit